MQDPDGAKSLPHLGYIEGWLSAAVNLVLFGLKLWVGLVSGSVAMVADAWHTLSDTLTSLVVLFGFWVAQKPADEQHPFGHGRAEVIGAVVISTLLAIVGFNFLAESVQRLRMAQEAHFGRIAIMVFLGSVVLKEAMARFSIWAGKKIDSQSLLADGWHHRSDAVASGLIVIGALGGRHWWWVDGALGLVVSLLIFKAAYDVFKDTSDILMGEKADRDLAVDIKRTLNEITGDTQKLHHIHIHRYGNHKEVTFHLCYPGEATLNEAHAEVNRIEEDLKARFGIEATIHLDPIEDGPAECEPERKMPER